MLDAGISQAIRVARVLCITCMMTVHVWPGATAVIAADAGPVLDTLYFIAIQELGRASVPLLSIVSGFLFLPALAAPRPLPVIAGKAGTLLVPMMFWSAVILAMRLASAAAIGTPAPPLEPLALLDAVTGLTAPPANVPLAFLRDVFVCCAGAVLLARAARGRPRAALVLIALWTLAEVALQGLLLLRPAILVFFAVGLAVRAAGAAPQRLPLLPAAAALAAVALARGHAPAGSEAAAAALDYANRVAAALFFWAASLAVAGAPRLGPAVARLEPMIFTVFCTHAVTIALLAPVLRATGVTPDMPVYLLVFLGQIPLAFLAAQGFARLGRAVAPELHAAVTAQRRHRAAAPPANRPGPAPLR